jgi:hypothetical protein
MIFLMPLLWLLVACDDESGPKLNGELEISSQLYGVDSYYLYGYNYARSAFVKYSIPFSGSVIPDIINLPFKNPDGSIAGPSFNAPSAKNGFHLLGEFGSLDEASTYYENYGEADPSLPLSIDSDTVKQFQVWLQKTQLDHYVKLLVKDISYFEDPGGTEYVVVSMDFIYQNNGSTIFP